MKSGYRKTTRVMANKSGNIVFSPADKELGARLAGNSVDEAWADEHVRRSLQEVRATWTAREIELRTPREPPVTVMQIISHHVEHGRIHRVMVE